MAATYCWKILNSLFLPLFNLLSFPYKRYNQNKADSTVNKNRELLSLFVENRIREKRMLHVTMVSCLLGFIFSSNANCGTGPCHAWRFRDRFFVFKCKKDFGYPLTTAKAHILARTLLATTRQAIELESYPNHPRIQQVLGSKSQKRFSFSVGVFWR